MREDEARRDRAEQNRQYEADAQQACRQASNTAQDFQVGSTGVCEQKQDEPDFRETEEHLRINPKSHEFRPEREHQHSRKREDDRGRQNRAFQAMRKQTVEEEDGNEDDQSYHRGAQEPSFG